MAHNISVLVMTVLESVTIGLFVFLVLDWFYENRRKM